MITTKQAKFAIDVFYSEGFFFFLFLFLEKCIRKDEFRENGTSLRGIVWGIITPVPR